VKRALRTWVFVGGVAGVGIWSVTGDEYESLWKRADWSVRATNDPQRAAKEWAKLYENERN
jgi:hypothetical protein